MKLNLSTVFHVGFLNLKNPTLNRPKSSFSLEGSGLSISIHPKAWTKIARLGGRENYTLSKKSPRFYMALESKSKDDLNYCLENKFLIKATKYRAFSTDEEGEEIYSEHDTEALAQAESDDVRPVKGYSFGSNGIAYWKSHFTSEVSNALAQSFASIFYAEAHDYDGVWWNEILDVSSLSAPRGVIFQSKLNEWTITPVLR
jgi:hypothetical protein